MKTKFSSEQSGRSMIEVLCYISIGMVLGVSFLTAVNSGYHRFKLGRLNQELSDLKKVISQRYVVAENYKDVSFETLIEEKIVPHDLKDARHAMGGSVEIGKGDENGETFYIKFDTLTAHACTELGNRLWIVNDGSDLDKMEITKEHTWTWPYSTSESSSSHSYKLPAKPHEVAQACNPKICKDEEGNEYPCSENDIFIKWYFN